MQFFMPCTCQYLKQSNSGVFFLTVCLTKAKEPSLPYHLLIAKQRTCGFMFFLDTELFEKRNIKCSSEKIKMLLKNIQIFLVYEEIFQDVRNVFFPRFDINHQLT